MHQQVRGGIRIRAAHDGHNDEATFQNPGLINTKKCRFPDRQIDPFADLDATHLMPDVVGHGWVDGGLGEPISRAIESQGGLIGTLKLELPRVCGGLNH